MPISSKKIIQRIDSLPKRFTRSELLGVFAEPNPVHKKARGKKGKSRKGENDFSQVEKTIRILISHGFIKRVKDAYLKSSFILKGKIKSNTRGNAIVVTDEGDEILVYKENIGKAYNSDTVEVRIIDYNRGYLIGEVASIVTRKKDLYIAKITGKTKQHYRCTLLDTPGGTEITVPTKTFNLPLESYVLVSTDNEEEGNAIAILESVSIDDERLDFTRIRIKHALPEAHQEYEELARLQTSIPQSEISRRTDYRDLLTVTIDGKDAKDFDDAISLKIKDTSYILYVHIADVSHYVKKDGDLDREALNRGTSYYLGEQVIPMLPEALSNDLCSLREGQDRLCMTAEMHFDLSGNCVFNEYQKSVIHVDHRLTYESAEKLISAKGTDILSKLLKNLWELASLLKKRRMREGRIDLNLSDEKMVFENHRIKEIRFAERLKSHMVIEECMLSANTVVSRTLREQKIPALYRIHEDIELDSLKKLQKFFEYLQIRLPLKGKSGINLQKVIDSVKGKEYEQVVNLVILKSMMQAYYGIEPIGHYGLGFSDYTHFTSPIRRYPDLIVHRCLKNLIENKEAPYTTGQLNAIAEKSSDTERVAQKAERDLIRLKSCRLLKESIGKAYRGIISGISRIGFFVTLLEMPVEGLVPLRMLTDDYYLVMEDDYTVIGKKYGKRYRLGDEVDVILSRVDIEEMKIDFTPGNT